MTVPGYGKLAQQRQQGLVSGAKQEQIRLAPPKYSRQTKRKTA